MIIAETDRLLLRHFHIVDGDAIDRVLGDPAVMEFSLGVKSPAQVRTWIAERLEHYHTRGFGQWAIVEKSSRQVIGYCGLTRFDEVGGQPETEIGYRLAKPYWGKGHATEAATAVRDYAFDVLCLPRVISIIEAKNVRSIRVAEKVGMRYEKDAVFHGFDVRVYAMNQGG